MSNLEALTAELAIEYTIDRRARPIHMRHAVDGQRTGTLWWCGGPDHAEVVMMFSRTRINRTLAEWESMGWVVESIEAPSEVAE